MNVYFDTETCGLYGPLKLIQYALDDGPVKFIRFETDGNKFRHLDPIPALEFVQAVTNPDNTIIGFNLEFDMYHLYRYLHLLFTNVELDSRLEYIEPVPCPVVDLLLHARKHGPFAPWAHNKKKSDDRIPTRIKRVPKVAEKQVTEQVTEVFKKFIPEHGKINVSRKEEPEPDLITLIFTPTVDLGLKAHAKYYGFETMAIDDVWPLMSKGDEKPWLPYYDYNIYYPTDVQCDQILSDRSHPFWEYAENDIIYTRNLYKEFGCVSPSHDDVVCAAVAYTRYRGIEVDKEKALKIKHNIEKEMEEINNRFPGKNLESPADRLQIVQSHLPFATSAKREVLDALLGTDISQELKDDINRIITYKPIKQKLDQINKALESRTGRLHVSLNIVGTATNRMSGSGGFNIQGVSKGESLRTCLLTSIVGDFAAFEITIAQSVWGDDKLDEDLRNGIDIHMYLASKHHPRWPEGLKYEDADKEDKEIKELRAESKAALVFGPIYGATHIRVAEIFGIDVDDAEKRLNASLNEYQGLRDYVDENRKNFCTGDTVTWDKESVKQMKRKVTDLTGFSRHFDFEAQVADALWRMEPPKGLPNRTTLRREEKGHQTITRAVKSAYLGAALGIQSAVFRQANNAPIQSAGANICKKLQAHLWEKFKLPMIQIHDEIVCVERPDKVDYKRVEEEVEAFCREWRGTIPHINFEMKPTKYWSDK